MILRPYQSRAVSDIGDALSLHRAVLYSLPTGAGKTVVFAEVARLCHDYGTRACILVHRDSLLAQASAKLADIGVPHSIIAPGRTDFGDAVHVASVQTLVRRLDRHDFDLLIIDEAHHAVAGSYRRIIDAWPEAQVLGVTATPARMDGRGLSEAFGALVAGPSVRDLMDQGYLSEAVAYGASRLADLGRVRTTAGDYNLKDLEDAMDRRVVTGDAVEHYSRICPGAPAIAFCVSVRHAQDVAQEFRAAGYRAESVDGRMPLPMVRARLAGLQDGSVQVLASCDLVSEGFDAPGVAAAIMLRPTKSLSVHMQQAGRALRPAYAAGMPLGTDAERRAAMAASVKPRTIILDHAGNSFRHGLVDDPREWSLDAKRRRPGAPGLAVRQCPECFAHCANHKRACPFCGHAFVVVAATRDVEREAGELVELDRAAMSRLRRREEGQARTYRDLVELGRRRGYMPQWAYRRWIERGGDPRAAHV